MYSSSEDEGSEDETSSVYPETMLDKIKRNAPGTTTLSWGFFLRNMNMTDDGWEELGRKYRINYHHTLAYIYCELLFDILRHIIMATQINTKNENNAEAAGREKVTQTQLNSERRAELADLQGVNQSLATSRAGRAVCCIEIIDSGSDLYDEEEGMPTTAKLHITGQAIEAELAAIEAADGHDGNVVDVGREPRSNKRRRKWWWSLWGGT
eukprot:scaffold3000_cov98-Skeletonema_marinoi.AAC.1